MAEEFLDEVEVLKSNVLVGKSYSTKGWTLNLKDIEKLLPVKIYERTCNIVIDGIRSECRLKINPRLFFSDKKLIKYLKDLNQEDPKQKIPLEIRVKKENLYENFIDKYPFLNQVNHIDMDFKVGKSFSNGQGNIPLDVLSLIVPVNEYEVTYDIDVNGVESVGNFNLLTRLYFSNPKLINYLKMLYEQEPNQIVHAKILFFNEEKNNNVKKIVISSETLYDAKMMESVIDWKSMEEYVVIKYESPVKSWRVNFKQNNESYYTKMFSSKSDALLSAILYLKEKGVVDLD